MVKPNVGEGIIVVTTKNGLVQLKWDLSVAQTEARMMHMAHTAEKLDALNAQLVPGMTFAEVARIGTFLVTEWVEAVKLGEERLTGRIAQVCRTFSKVYADLAG